MRDKPSPELMRALETLGKRSVQPPATPQEPALPSGSPDGYMESLMARRKAVKLLEALAESCDRPDGEDDHDWHQCRSCVAAFSLTQTGAKALLRSLLAELTRASTPSPEGQTWQPIETAPKDGTRVLLFHPLWQAASTGQFYGSRQGWKLDSTLPPFTMQPTYWMPPPDVLPLLRCALLIPEESEP